MLGHYWVVKRQQSFYKDGREIVYYQVYLVPYSTSIEDVTDEAIWIPVKSTFKENKMDLLSGAITLGELRRQIEEGGGEEYGL